MIEWVMKDILLIVALFFVGFVTFLSPVYVAAQDNSAAITTSVYPSDGFRFILKRLGEKIRLALFSVSPSAKANFFQKVYDSRLAELIKVASDKDIANIETTSSRYSAIAGQMTEYILSSNLESIENVAREQIATHIPIIQKLQENYNQDTAEWRFLENNINSNKIYLDKFDE